MIKVLIIDDEPIVRQGLRLVIPWNENEFEICGEAENFQEGLEKIENLNPNIVLTDIKIPGGFGTELIKNAVDDGFKGKFIIISGYSNFEYAKTAIKYGVKSYILKPIDEDELLDILLKIKKEIVEEEELKRKSNIVKKIQIERYILGLTSSMENNYSDVEKLQIALIYSKGILLEKLNEFIINNFECNFDILVLEGNIALIMKNTNEKYCLNALKILHRKIKDKFDTDIFCVLSESTNSPENLNRIYESAKLILNKKFLYMENKIMCVDASEANVENVKYEFNITILDIANFVELGDLTILKDRIKKMILLQNIEKYSQEKIKFEVAKIYTDVRNKLINDYNLKYDDIEKDIISEIYEKESLDQALEYLINKFSVISLKINESSSNNIIKKIINYISKNYYKDIKLEFIGEIFNYNSAYLGKLFKSNTGESFNTYLDKIRIEKAKELLGNKNLKVYQVCEKVGYKNIDYFHSKFKKYVGMSPRKFKKENNTLQ